jgi:hypothetical protein
MSGKISFLPTLIFCLVIIAGCSASRVPSYYLHGPVAAKKMVTGNWIEIITYTSDSVRSSNKFSGELIAVNSDTVFIMTPERLCAIKKSKIETATLFIFRNLGTPFATATGIGLLPDLIGVITVADYASEFLRLGLPWLIYGSVFSIFEGFSKESVLVFPERNSLEDFIRFARFPMGIPREVNRNELHLIMDKKPS